MMNPEEFKKNRVSLVNTRKDKINVKKLCKILDK